jgi:excisionase family DNA binding protein
LESWTGLLSPPILLPMTDTARDYQTLTTADTNGLDDLFNESVTRTDNDPDSAARPDSSDKNPDDGQVTDLYWTPQEAAKFFGVSVRTIRRRLQDGSLSGYKFTGVNGPEWRVNPVTRTDNNPDSPAKPDRSDSPANDSVTVAAQDNNPLIEKLFDYLHEKDELIQAKEKDLQTASATIGYLKAQIEAQEQQLKLLTDSQHKQGWWARFTSWFFKGQ